MAPTEIVIHARYMADGSIAEISERPEALSGQQWFNFLCKQVPMRRRRWRAAASSSAFRRAIWTR
jgi:hypothetical protein